MCVCSLPSALDVTVLSVSVNEFAVGLCWVREVTEACLRQSPTHKLHLSVYFLSFFPTSIFTLSATALHFHLQIPNCFLSLLLFPLALSTLPLTPFPVYAHFPHRISAFSPLHHFHPHTWIILSTLLVPSLCLPSLCLSVSLKGVVMG